jgi:hypothetical protein
MDGSGHPGDVGVAALDREVERHDRIRRESNSCDGDGADLVE